MGERARRLRKLGRAAEDALQWDPLDLAENPYDRRNVWSSDAPGPPQDLDAYASERGLRWSREGALLPFHCIHAWGDGTNLNTTRGPLSGRAFGVLGHQRREHEVQGGFKDASGTPSGAKVAHIREGHTFAATLVPETRRTLVAAAAYASQLSCDAYGVTLEPLENDRTWRLDLHPRGERALFDAIWNGPSAESLRAAYPWGEPGRLIRRPAPGGKFDVRGGIVSVWAPGYLEEPAELDGLIELLFGFAAELKAVCAPRVKTESFDDLLPPPPGWTGQGKAFDTLSKSLDKAKSKRVRRGLAPRDDLLDPGEHEDERWAGLRDFAAGYCKKRDLQLEDGAAFDRAFPELPYTGWAQFAGRGSIRGGKPYRVALAAQRPFVWQPAFATGGAVAVAPETHGAPDEPLRTDATTGCLHAVSGGLRSVAFYNPIPEIGYRELDLVTAELERALR